MQGSEIVKLSDLRSVKDSAKPNDDDYLAQMVRKRADQLGRWADSCSRPIDQPEVVEELASGTVDPLP